MAELSFYLIRKWTLVSFLFLHLCLVTSSSSDLLSSSAVEEATQVDVDESVFVMMDAILADLTEKYDTIKADNFWHPFDFGTGNEIREVLRVQSVGQHHIPGDFIEWKTTKLGRQQQLVGLTTSSVEIYDSSLNKKIMKTISASLKTMEIFTKWDVVNLKPFMILLVVTDEPNVIVLKSNGNDIEELGTFPLHSQVKSLSMCLVDNSEKVMMVPDSPNSPITIYNVEISSEAAQLWFFQRFSEPGFQSAVVHQPDTADSILIVSQTTFLNIYQFDASVGQFSIQQTMGLHERCDNMFHFTMLYQHYLGCSAKDESQEVQFIAYNYNMNEYEEKDSFKKLQALDIFPISIEGSRDDTIFISQDADKLINVLIFDGQNEFHVGHMCSLDACNELETFSKGASFVFEDTTAFVFPTPTETGTSSGAPVIVFTTEVLAKSSPVFDQSLGLFNEFKTLSQQMDMWRNIVVNAEDTLSKSLNTTGDNFITGHWNLKSVTTDDVTIASRSEDEVDTKSENIFNSLKFGDVDWTEEDFESTHEELVGQMDEMENIINFLEEKLQDALLRSSADLQTISATTLVHGNLAIEQAKVKIFTVSTLHGQKPKDYFNNLAHPGKDVLNIPGGLAFSKPLSVNRLQTATLNEVPVDSFARLTADNIFECVSNFESLETLQDVEVTTVNDIDLAQSVVKPSEGPVTGFRFIDGIVAYGEAKTLEKFPFEDVMLSSVSQTVKSPLVFQTVEVLAPISLRQINGKDFQEFADKVILNNHVGKILGMKTFTDTTGAEALFIEKTWNGLEFPGAFFTERHPEILLAGEKSFAKILAEKVIVEGEIDGINTNDLVTLSEPDALQSTWHFQGMAKIRNDIEVAQTVDGIFMESLIHVGTLDVASSSYVPNADIRFTQPVHIQELTVNSKINEKTFDEIFGDLILFEGTECLVPGTTTITNEVVFGNMDIEDKMINGFTIENFLTKDTPQTIESPVIFMGNAFFQQMFALEDFDRVKVTDVLAKALRVSNSMVDGNLDDSATMISWPIQFESVKCSSNLRVEGPINEKGNYGQSVAVTKGNRANNFAGQIVLSSPTFTSFSTGELMLDPGRTLQGMDVDHWSKTSAKLSESATFTLPVSVDRVSVAENLDTSVVNEIAVDILETQVFRNDREFQEFTGPITLLSSIAVFNGGVKFLEHVDGFSLDDLIEHGFPLNSGSEDAILINGNWKFEDLAVDKNLEVNGAVCGVNLEALQADSVMHGEEDLKIFGEKTFSRPLTVTKSVTAPQINDKQLDKVFRLSGGKQEVEGHATFSSNVFKDKLEVNSINGVSMDWLSSIYSFQDGKHVISHDVAMDDLRSDSLRVTGNTQGHDLDQFIENCVKLTDPFIQFSDRVTFANPAFVDGDIHTDFYNDVDMKHLLTNVVKLNEDITIKQPIQFTKTLQTQNLQVNGNVDAKNLANGVNWNELRDNAIFITDDNEPLDLNNFQFEHLVASNNIEVQNLNGIPFENYATVNSPQDLGQLKIKNVFIEGSNVDVKGKFGPVNIVEEFQDTLMSNTAEPHKLMGQTLIRGPVEINSDINCFGQEAIQKLVTTRDNIELPGQVEFKSPLVIEKDVIVKDPTIQGRPIKSIFANAFTTNGGAQVVSKNWDFQGPVTFMDDVSGTGVQDAFNIQSLVLEKEEEIRQAEEQVSTERDAFVEKCTELQDLTNELAKNPVKLDSFDMHQVISLKQEAKNILAVESENNVMLFVETTNCQLQRFQWNPVSDAFQTIVETSPVIGNVEAWQSVLDRASGNNIVVFSKTPSACSDESGLFAMVVTPSGELSPVTLMSMEVPQSFKLASHPTSAEVVLFALFGARNQELAISAWDGAKFEQNELLQFETSAEMERVDATATSKGFSIMTHNKQSVHIYEYSSGSSIQEETRSVLAKPVLASVTSPMAVFDSYDLTYAVVPESGTTPALIQPTCNFNVIRFSHLDGTSQTVQKLQLPEVKSATQWIFANDEYMAFLSKSHGLTVHRFMGLNGFQQQGMPYKVFGGLKLESFGMKRSEFDTVTPFLTVLSPQTVEVYRGKVFGVTYKADFTQLCNLKVATDNIK